MTNLLRLFKAGFLVVLLLLTGVAFAQNARIKGTITDAENNDPLPGVSVVVTGTKTGTAANVTGEYQLELAPGSYTLKFLFIGYAIRQEAITLAAGQQLELNVSLSPSLTMAGEVIVTGTRASGRSQLESPVPVDVIKVSDLNITAPQLDLNQLLTFVAPSFQANRQSSSDETEHIDPASLRGMGPDQVLVLINGKRRHTSSLVNTSGTFGRGSVGTDLSTIPTMAIDRIEILRDGAAAQYGSDAIAGVINIVLRSDTDALSGIATTGVHKAGDGDTYQMALNYGLKIGEKGFINVTGQFSDREFTNRATGDHTLNVYVPGFAYFGDAATEAADNAEIARRGKTRDDFRFRVGDAAMQTAATFFNASLPVSDETEIYAFGGLSNKQGRGAPFRRLPQEAQNVPAIFPDGFQPETVSDITDRSLSVGVRGKLKGWDVDFNNTFGSNRFDFGIVNTVNTTLGASSPTSFRSGGFYFSQNVTGMTFNRFYSGALAGINIATGAEYRVDHYRVFPGEEASWRNYGIIDTVINNRITQVDVMGLPPGSRGFVGFRPDDEVNAYRNNLALFADAEFNLSRQFLVATALRFERYSDFGNTLNGKLAARYIVNSVLTVRGAFNTGFRAPSLHQLYFNKISTDLVNGQLVEIGTFDNQSRAASILGIPRLKQETSNNYSVGLTLQPLSNLSITADVYQIDVKDRIILTSNFVASELPANVRGEFINAGLQAANFFTNAIDTRTRGLDLIASYDKKIGEGKLDVTLAANFNSVEIMGAVNTSPQLSGQSDTYLQVWDRLRIEQNNPRSKYTLTGMYSIGRLMFMLRGVRFGEVTLQPGEAFGVMQTYSPQLVTDVSITARLMKGIALTIGANNLFDQYPDRQHPDNSYLGVFPYPPVQQGMNGAYYFGRLSFNF